MGDNVQITIVGGSYQDECDATCGTDWSSAEALAIANKRIVDRFGDRLKLVYVDMSKDAANHDTQQWMDIIKDQKLSLPLLLVNGQLRISGQFDIRQLLDVIEVELELGV